MAKTRRTLLEANPTLAAQWHPTKNGDLTPADVAPGAARSAWWVCPEGHEWDAVINSRNRGRGCPVCSGDLVSRGHNDLATTHPELAEQWAGPVDGNHTPFEVSAGSKKKVRWMCELGHEWEAQVATRSAGRGCPFCAGQQVWPGFNDLASQHPELAAMWDHEKNGGPGPKGINVGTPARAHWKCQRGHTWSAPVRAVVRNKVKCKECARMVAPDIVAQWDEELNGGPMPADLHANSRTTAWWKCPEGHSWEASVATRSRGRGCTYCSGTQVLSGFNDLFTTSPQLKPEWDWEANTGLDPLQLTAGSGKRAHWVCARGHRWQAIINSRARGARCAECLREDREAVKKEKLERRERDRKYTYLPTATGQTIRLAEKGASFLDKFPELAAQWHPTKNGDLTPEQISPSSSAYFWWTCDHGHEWEVSPSARVHAPNCPYCAGTRSVPVRAGWNDLASREPELAAEWHPTKNGDLTPDAVRFATVEKVWWSCSEGHSYQCSPAARRRGRGCPYCSGKKVLVGFNDLATTQPEIAAQWNYKRNGEVTPTMVTAGSAKKRWWKCEHGHEWDAPPKTRTKGAGCPYCAGTLLLSGYNDLATTHPQLLAEWDYELNGDVLPTEISGGSAYLAHWACETCGHKWQTKIAHRTHSNSNCPNCYFPFSKVELRLREWLGESPLLERLSDDPNTKLPIPWRTQRLMRVDIHGYLAGLDQEVVIEYDGEYWHTPKAEMDVEKTAALLDAGILVARVRENELPHLELDHPNLFQVSATWHHTDDSEIVAAAEQIESWLWGKLPADHPLRGDAAA